MSRTRRTIGAVVCTAALLAVSAGAANAAPAQRSLPGSVPSWANAAQRAGSVTGSASVTFRVYLDYSDATGAAAYAMSVSTKGSANYGKYLTPGQFTAKFAPTQASVNAVSSWLKGQGFAVGDVPANRKYVEATGTLDQAAAAFGTSFAEYTVSGKTVRGNTKPLVVPASLSMVEGVVGLDESQMLAVANKVSAPPAGFRNATPCSAYWGEKTVTNTPVSGVTLPTSPDTWAPCGYAGEQLQGVYGVNTIDTILADGNTGQGVTIGVIDAYASPTIVSDTNTYFTKHGLPAWTKGQFTEVVPPGIYNKPTSQKQDPSGWAGEETLDIEAVHTMAPGANVVYYGAPNNFRDMDALMNRVVMANKVDIVTNSYGYGGEALPMGTIKPSLDTQIQAAAQGISLFFSSGDSGDETGGVAGAKPSPDWPASSPFVTAVGGTSIGISEANSRVFELGWETGRSTLASGAWTTPPSYLYGSGGGTSRLFAQPSYQAGIVPDSMSQTYGGAKMRVVPDVSALGDPTTGMLVGETQAFSDGTYYDEYRIGGTSLSSPIYAGIFALAVHEHGRYGLANPALYAAAKTAYDITKTELEEYPGAVRSDFINSESASGGYRYTARWFDYDSVLTIHVGSGYDNVTGVGSPNGSGWFDAVVSYKS
jgi:subtilase family serine protease